MRKSYILIHAFLLSATLSVFTACSDYLDRDDDDKITEADAFSRYEKVNGMVSDVYAAAKKADRPLVFFEHFSNSAITDECEGTNVEGNITNNFNNGAWNPNSLPGSCGQYWESLYEGIRKTNLIIENVEKYDTPDNPQQDGDLRKRIGEMYFMRGYFHMLLARMYGEIPYIDRVIHTGDNMDFKKESVHSIVEKIVTDAQTAFEMVPNKYIKTSENFGRVDQGACLGLIAYVRWIAATPLWNGASDYGYTLSRVFESEYAYDADRWRKAKDAADAVLNFEVGGTKRYSLYEEHDETDFKDPAGGNLNDSRVYARLWDMFYDMDAFANEYVFFMTKSKDQAWQGDIYPPSREGSSRQQPVQEQVDEYEYIVDETAFGILQAGRARTSKTEYISCPGCGRTLYDLEATIARIKAATSHLKGLKIGIMGCIVNGPGEMADADYGYVGAGRGKISLYKKKECIEKNIPEEQAVEKLIELIKANGDYKEK